MILNKITWEEFEKIIQILKSYKLMAKKNKEWFDKIIPLLEKVEKQNYNIKVENLDVEDFERVTWIVDGWNELKNVCDDSVERIPYDVDCDAISRKLMNMIKAKLKDSNKEAKHEIKKGVSKY